MKHLKLISCATRLALFSSAVLVSSCQTKSGSGDPSAVIGVGSDVDRMMLEFAKAVHVIADLNENGEATYQRNGQFQLDRQGFIVNPTGAKLTGYPANASGVLLTGSAAPLSINTADLVPQSTTTVNAVSTVPSASGLLPKITLL